MLFYDHFNRSLCFEDHNPNTHNTNTQNHSLYKYSYPSNPFPKVIPDGASNSFNEEYTQLSSNRNKPEELMSTYWGNRFEEQEVGTALEPHHHHFDKQEKKNSAGFFFAEQQEKNKKEEFLKVHCPNKFHYNPEGPMVFSTPPIHKFKVKEEGPRHFGSTNLGLYKNSSINAFSDYFNSEKKCYSVDPIWEYESGGTYSRDFSLQDNYDENSRNSRGTFWGESFL